MRRQSGSATHRNGRKENATSWELEVHAGPDPLGRMLSERPGDVVVISDKNRGKIDRIRRSVNAGFTYSLAARGSSTQPNFPTVRLF